MCVLEKTVIAFLLCLQALPRQERYSVVNKLYDTTRLAFDHAVTRGILVTPDVAQHLPGDGKLIILFSTFLYRD